MRLGSPDAQNSRPYVLAFGKTVYLVYKSFDGTTTTVELMTSHDSGKTWSAPHGIAQTSNESDHPLLIANRTTPYLSWMTLKEGYRLIPLEPQS